MLTIDPEAALLQVKANRYVCPGSSETALSAVSSNGGIQVGAVAGARSSLHPTRPRKRVKPA
jgi:hypothetical protein